MVRLFLVALCAFSLAARALASPPLQIALNNDNGAHVLAGWSYVNCGSPDDAIQLESLNVNPDPPQPGKDLAIKVVGKVMQKIEDGAFADVTVKLGLVKLLHKQFDVCEEARNNNVTLRCPVDLGSYEVEHSVKLPREIPRAKFTVAVRGFTEDEKPMVCLDLKVDFMKRPFFKS